MTSLTAFRLLNLRRFMEHRARTLLSVSGIAIGGALVVGVLGLLGSLTGSVEGFIDDVAGLADLEVSAVSDAGFEESRFFDIAAAPGVKTAVPLIRSRALVNRKPVLLVGLDQRAEALSTALSREQKTELFAKAGQPGLFLGSQLASQINVEAGEKVKVFSTGGEVEIPVLGVIESEAATFNQGRFAISSIPMAQQILGKPARLDTVFVIADKGKNLEELKRELSPVVGSGSFVDSPSGRARQAKSTTQSLRFGMTMGVIIALIVGGFLIFNTMSMAALERRRELATLRALGGKRRQLLLLFLLESAFFGLVGSALGAVVGFLAARKLVDAIPGFYAQQVEVQVQMHMPVLAIPGALLAGMTASVIAAFLPARQAVGVSPSESMRPEGVLESVDEVEGIAPKPAIIGFLLAVSGFVAAVAGPSSLGFVGMGAFMTGTIVCTYGLTQPLAAATSTMARRFGTTGRLAAAGLERAPRRAWATSVAVVAGVGMVVAQGGATRNVNASVARSVGSLQGIDLFVSAAAGTSLATDVLLPGKWGEQLAAIPGMANVASSTFTFVNYKQNKIVVQAVERSLGAEPAMAGISRRERDLVQQGKAAVVSTRFSELFEVEKGDWLTLPTPTGPRRIRVVGSVPSFTWERGLVTIGRGLLVDWFGRTGVSDYLLTLEPGAHPPSVKQSVERFVEDAPIPVYLSSGSEYLGFIRGTVNQVNRLFDALAAVVVGAAVLAIFNALLISVIERRRELGIMRALGTSRVQLRGMVAVEAAALGLVGGILGVSIGFLAHKASIAAVARQGGMPIEYAFVVEPAAAALVVGMVMALLGSLEPARRAGSFNIIEAIGYE